MQGRKTLPPSLRVTRIALALVAGAIAGVVIATILLILSTHSARADHDSMYLICPDPIEEGNTASMGLRHPGHRVVYAYFFTHEGAYTASPNDFTEYHGVKFESDSDESTLWVPIITTEDDRPEHDEIFAIGFRDDYEWHECRVTIVDDDGPEITRVAISSRPVDGYAYRAGESIDITVSTTAPVEVDGTPLMALFLGDGESSAWRGAEYLTGSGSQHLVFRYRVQPEDFDADGLTVGAAAVADNRTPAYGFAGNIFYKGTDVPIDYTHPGVTGDWKQRVDGRPYVQRARFISSPAGGRGVYRANEVVELAFTFDTRVVVDGDVSIGLYLGLENYNWGEAERRAGYLRGSGSDTLVFGYTIQPGDTDPKGIGLLMGTESTGFGGGGTIKHWDTGIERNPWYRGTGHQPGHKVDTTPPSVSSFGITSRPANDISYTAGETITVQVVFSEGVTVRGVPSLELDVGGAVRQAFVLQDRPDFGSVLEFGYVVQEGDVDYDGVGIGANRLNLNGGSIEGRAGIPADLSHAALPAASEHKVAAD